MIHPDLNRLYKYRPINESTLRMLINKKVWISTPAGFNDPFEFNFYIENDTDLGEVVKKGLNKIGGLPENATNEDFHTEYLANILNIKVVDGVDEAISHIIEYGSGHSESILSENMTTSEKFLNSIDASSVYVNASTRFTDGGAFGFGAEVGISTNKLHARGPMGIEGLTTYKFKIYGNGQSR